MTDDADPAFAALVRDAAQRLTPVDAFEFYDKLSADEAKDLLWSVIGIIQLEATLNQIVARYSDRSPAKIDRATLGTLITWADPILRDQGFEEKDIKDLRELNRFRIALLHRLPMAADFGGTNVWTYRNIEEAVVQVRDVYPYGTLAWLMVRERLSQLLA